MAQKQILISDYFKVHELEKGIYAAMTKENTGVLMNAGFFDLGDYLMIFDTTIHPEATRDLIKVAHKITGKNPSFLVNSHFHFDHTMGNHVFPIEVPIIASPGTLNQYEDFIPNRFQQFLDQSASEMEKLKKQIENEDDESKLFEMESDLKFWEEITDPKFTLRPPNFLVEKELTIIGQELKIRLINVGAAHSPGDIIAYFPNEKICFMADVIFEEPDPDWRQNVVGIPFATDPENHIKVLKEYKEKDIEIYFTSHGNLCSKEILQRNIDYIKKYWMKS